MFLSLGVQVTQLESLSAHQISAETELVEPMDSNVLNRQTIEQTMERLPNGVRRLAAQLRTPLNIAPIWSVLTDYDHLSEFIPNLSSSSVISRKGDCVHLKQVGSQEFFGFRFSAQVHLELNEDRSAGVLRFHLIKGDFRRFEGSWRIRELAGGSGSCLLYELTVQGCIGMPVALIEQHLREDLSNNLLAVEQAASGFQMSN